MDCRDSFAPGKARQLSLFAPRRPARAGRRPTGRPKPDADWRAFATWQPPNAQDWARHLAEMGAAPT